MTDRSGPATAYDLGFPYHVTGDAPDRLKRIGAFMAQNDLAPDVFCSGAAIDRLEARLAGLLGTEAALWFPTGTMAQAVAARIHLSGAAAGELLLHPTSHAILHEEDGYRHAHGFRVRVAGDWRAPMDAGLIDDRTACVFIELAQRHSGGRLPSWAALAELKSVCAERGIALHMDGARLWSCRPYYDDRPYAEIAAGFNSVYVSFYKDIGALGGAALAGDKRFCDEARLWRTRLGGLLVEPWPMVCDALRLLDGRLEQMPLFVAKAREMAEIISARTALRVDPGVLHVNLFHIMIERPAAQVESALKAVTAATGVRLGGRVWAYEGEGECALEVTVGEKALNMPLDRWSEAVEVLAREAA